MPRGTHRTIYGTREQIQAQLDGAPAIRPSLILPPPRPWTVVGIDPGKSGGLATLRNGRLIDWRPMPRRGARPDGAAIEAWVRLQRPTWVFMEHVQSFSRDGHRSAFNFGGERAILEDAIARAGHQPQLVYPQTWQAAMLYGRADQDTKVAAREVVARLYPDTNLILPRCRVPHEGVVDAILIACWGLHFGRPTVAGEGDLL